MAAARPASRCVPLLVVSGLFLLSGLACGGRGDIQAGLGAAGVRLGDDRAAVERTLGKAEQVNSAGVGGEKQKESTYLLYPSKGIDVLLEDGKVRSLFLYQEGIEDHRRFPGRTSDGLTLSSKREEILSTLGDPSARGLGDNADRWFRYDSGIEFSFTPEGKLHHIVVSHPR
ncbi:MAG TPA: hypothetical protein VKL61_09610 [Candidatus Polarisedimenticolia bacterium]|nr:hypothetical protein [Candidatus Polarisedimenticolia bacterium]